MSSFCSAKATHIFSAKDTKILYIESAKTVNEMTLNDALNNRAQVVIFINCQLKLFSFDLTLKSTYSEKNQVRKTSKYNGKLRIEKFEEINF